MGKRGSKPKEAVLIKWSSNFAYAIGLIASDGCLSKDGRHVDVTSKDLEQLFNFQKALNTNLNIGIKNSGKKNQAYRLQIGDVLFYRFLNSIGLTKVKSLTVSKLNIPDEYFFDFLRGVFDGDGTSYSYFDPRWRSSFMFYIGFASGSIAFLNWLRESIVNQSGLKGHISIHRKARAKNSFYQLRYSKYEAIKLSGCMYKNNGCMRLSRKYLKIQQSLAIVRRHKGRIFVQ